MDLATRKKYSSQGRTIVKGNLNYIDVKFDLNVLNLFCSFVISENQSIRKGSLIAMRNLMEIIKVGGKVCQEN